MSENESGAAQIESTEAAQTEAETTVSVTETTTQTVPVSELQKERKARQKAERELKARQEAEEEARKKEMSEKERADAEAKEWKTKFQSQVINSRKATVRAYAIEAGFTDPADAILRIDLSDEDMEDEKNVKKAVAKIAEERPYLLKSNAPGAKALGSAFKGDDKESGKHEVTWGDVFKAVKKR